MYAAVPHREAGETPRVTALLALNFVRSFLTYLAKSLRYSVLPTARVGRWDVGERFASACSSVG